MKRLRSFTLVLTVMSLASITAFGADYSKEMKKAFQKAFKGDFKHYQFFGTPVANFGTGTMYPKSATGSAIDLTTTGLYGNPETWWVPPTLTNDERKSLLSTLRPEGPTGPVAFQLDTSKKFGLDVVLPGLYKLLTASGNVSWSKKVTVRLSADTMINHRLDWTVLADDIAAPPKIKESVLQHLSAKDYVITTGDVVLTNYKANLIIDQNLSSEAKAQLDSAWKAFSSGSKVDLTFTSGEQGNYSISSTAPVVVAVFVEEPPPGAVRSAQKRSMPAQLSVESINQIALKPNDIPDIK